MPPKKTSAPVKSRLLSKNLTQRLEEAIGSNEEAVQGEPADTPLKQDEPKISMNNNVREEPKGLSKSVIIVEKPREAMIGQGIPVRFEDDPEFTIPLIRVGVERMGGSLFHCLLRAIYPPYMEWNREKRLRKVKEFRQDLATNFDGYFMRLDQKNFPWPSLSVCKKDLESSDGPIQYEFLDYIGKVINKSIVILTVTKDGILQPVFGTRVYAKQAGNSSASASSAGTLETSPTAKTSSPITYARAEPVFIYILHLGGPAFELMCYRKNGTNYTLFPESHLLTEKVLGNLVN